jgi:chromosome segregation ATPase
MTDGELEFFRHTFHHFGERLGRLQCSVDEVLTNQRNIDHKLQEIKRMSTNAVTQEQFASDLNSLQTALGTMITNVQSDIAALKAQIAAGQPVDFSALDATVAAMSSAVGAENTAVEADQAPPATTPTAA